MSLFNQQELQFLLTAVNDEVKRTGLVSAAIGLVVAAKLQDEAHKLASLKLEPSESEKSPSKKA